MRLLVRTFALAGLLSAVAPASAGAAPLVALPSDVCTGLVPATANCAVFQLGTLTSQLTFDGSFESNADIALFEFFVDGESTFFARTTSFLETGFDSILGLFNAATREIVPYIDPLQGPTYARGSDVDPFGESGALNYDDQLGSFVIARGTYLLALLNTADGFNSFTADGETGIDSLLAGFGCDTVAECAGGGGNFTLSVQATPLEGGPAPVPEPGTLALLGSGALAALARRRAKKARVQ
jgi:hypothetical protein